MTIAEKLASIKASKEAIKQAIEAKGVACGDVLSEYPDKIAGIPTGGVDMTYVTSFSKWKFTTEQFEALNTYNWDNVTSMSCMFEYCNNLTTIPLIDTSKVTSMNHMFEHCDNLTTIPLIDTSKVTDMSFMFYQCYNLTNLGGFTNLSVKLDLSYSTLLTEESLMNVINNLKDLTGGTAQTLTLGSANLKKLTDEQKAVATNKNWVLV